MEGWQKIKPNTPFGQLPLLEVDGELISESVAIVRYCAREFGLAGKTTFESAQADEIVDALQGALEKQYEAFIFEKVTSFIIFFPVNYFSLFGRPLYVRKRVEQSL